MNQDDRDLLLLFWSGELDEPETRRAQELIDRDPAAVSYLQEMSELDAVVANLPDPTPCGIAGRAIKFAPRRRRGMSVGSLIGIATASTFLIVVLLTVMVKPMRQSFVQWFSPDSELEEPIPKQNEIPVPVPEPKPQEQVVETPPNPAPVPTPDVPPRPEPKQQIVIPNDLNPLTPKPLRDPIMPEEREEISVVTISKQKGGFEVFAAEPDSDIRVRLESARERIRSLREKLNAS